MVEDVILFSQQNRYRHPPLREGGNSEKFLSSTHEEGIIRWKPAIEGKKEKIIEVPLVRLQAMSPSVV